MPLHVTEAEAVVLEVRNIPIVTHEAREAAEGWAVALAAAEVYDEKKTIPWIRVWQLAREDAQWCSATSEIAARAGNVRDGFIRSWIDAWLCRVVGLKCYGSSGSFNRVLR